MILSSINIIWIILYFAIVIGIGLWTKQRETTGEYLIAGRKIGVLQATASIFAVLGAVLLVGQAALAYDLGFGAMWLWIGLGLGMVALGVILPKIKESSDEKGFTTIAGYLFDQFGYKSGLVSSIALFLAFFGLLTGQFIAGASLFAPLLNISYEMAVLLLGVGTLVYLLLGGFKAVIRTDLLQFIIMAIVFTLAILTLDTSSVRSGSVLIDLKATGSFTAFSLMILGFFAIIASADIWQRVFASADTKTAQKASYISGGLFVAFGFIVTLVGVVARQHFPEIDPAEALFFGLFELVPEALLGAIVIAILAAIMSTIDTELFYLSSSIANDFIGQKTKKTNEQIKVIIYQSLIILAIASMFVAIFLTDIIFLLFSLLSLTLCVAPTILASVFWKLKSNSVLLSVSGGLISLMVLLVIGNLTPDTASITLPIAAILLLIGQMFFKKEA